MLENKANNLEMLMHAIDLTLRKNSIKDFDLKGFLFVGDITVFSRDNNARLIAFDIDRDCLNKEIQIKLLENAKNIVSQGVHLTDNEIINKIIKIVEDDSYSNIEDFQKMKEAITMLLYYNNSAEVLINAINGNLIPHKRSGENLSEIVEILDKYIQVSYSELKEMNGKKRG